MYIKIFYMSPGITHKGHFTFSDCSKMIFFGEAHYLSDRPRMIKIHILTRKYIIIIRYRVWELKCDLASTYQVKNKRYALYV